MEQVMSIYNSFMGVSEQSKTFVQSDDLCCICQTDMTNTRTFTTKCNHTYHHDCVKLWFINKDNCPICITKVVTPILRSQCCEYTYETPKKEFSIYRFILYLLGACVTKTTNGNLIMNVLTKDINPLYSSIFYIFYFSDGSSLLKEEINKIRDTTEKIYYGFDVIRILISLYFSIYNNSFFLSLLCQLYCLSCLINSEVFVSKIKYSGLFFYNNFSNPIYYILYLFCMRLNNIFLIVSLFLGVNHISIKILSLIEILGLSFLFINTFSYVRLCIAITSKCFDSIIKSEYEGITKFYINSRSVGMASFIRSIITLIQSQSFNTMYRQFTEASIPVGQNNIPQSNNEMVVLDDVISEITLPTITRVTLPQYTEPIVETQTINSTVQIDDETITLSLDLSDLNDTESDYENVNEQHSDTN